MSPAPVLPKLSSSDIAQAQGRFTQALTRELIIRGEDLNAMTPIVNELRDQLSVTPKFSGEHEVRLCADDAGGRLGVTGAADYIVKAAEKRARIASYGENPEKLLEARLSQLGIPDPARAATGRVRRLDDGRVEAFTADGNVLFSSEKIPTPHKPDGTLVELPREELEKFWNPKGALEAATRAILREHEHTPRVDAVRASKVETMDAYGSL